ncbi:MAG: hypothetical protein ACI9TY_000775 [Alphaproteobacteria bacterium]|jgi:hypothetical protein
MANKTIENLEKLAEAVNVDIDLPFMILSLVKGLQRESDEKPMGMDDLDEQQWFINGLLSGKAVDVIAVARKVAAINLSYETFSDEDVAGMKEEFAGSVGDFLAEYSDAGEDGMDLVGLMTFQGLLMLFDTGKTRVELSDTTVAKLAQARAVPVPEAVTSLIDAVNAVLDSNEVFEAEQ